MGESKGKRLSVIVAGATGNTGRELVSRLVSHPDVRRVVALTRHPIPVNRWTTVFPNLHRSDALKYLSVVPLDWQKVMADMSNVPASYVSHGVWRVDEEMEARRHFMRRWKSFSQLSTVAGVGGSGEESETPATLVKGARPVGYVKFHPTGPVGELELGDSGGAAASDAQFSPRAAMMDSQRFLQLLLHNTFYRSIFSGHEVAINCIGTSHFLSSTQLINVDYDLSLAFGKMVRLFNCMEHAVPNDDEERLLVESTRQELDSALWGEIYAACYGARPAPSASAPASLGAAGHDNSHSNSVDTSESTVTPGLKTQQEELSWMRQRPGSSVTLRHFVQISVRAASSRSPITYLRAHGRRDRDLLHLFYRGESEQETQAIATAAPAVVGARAALHFGGSASAMAEPFTSYAATPPADAPAESVARRRAELLLRRDFVKIWESANVTIWRPGVLARPNVRFLEYLISLVERPLDPKCLAECIVDDIIDSLYEDDSRAGQLVGRVKVINGKSVARRVHMKAVEDGLDRHDTRGLAYFNRRLPRKDVVAVVTAFVLVLIALLYHFDD